MIEWFCFEKKDHSSVFCNYCQRILIDSVIFAGISFLAHEVIVCFY